MQSGPRFGIRTSIDCAHHLVGAGACEELHGHTYTVEAMAYGPCGDGRPLDLERLRMIVDGRLRLYDHRDLNDFFDMPTCEIFCQTIFNRLKRDLPGLCLLRVWEGHGKWAETTRKA
jgi:6-pyruvoyltetrahydropterin/6-carboxytetrahydropterin synthase